MTFGGGKNSYVYHRGMAPERIETEGPLCVSLSIHDPWRSDPMGKLPNEVCPYLFQSFLIRITAEAQEPMF